MNAPPARVYAAINAVRADDIRLFRTLTWIRRFGRTAAEGILAPSSQRPILDVATTTGFLRLADEPAREVVIGVILPVRPDGPPFDPSVLRRPETFMPPHQSGLCLVGMNFLIRPDGPYGSVLSTETRIFATDAIARRAFATYWRTIYPGSATIRRNVPARDPAACRTALNENAQRYSLIRISIRIGTARRATAGAAATLRGWS